MLASSHVCDLPLNRFCFGRWWLLNNCAVLRKEHGSVTYDRQTDQPTDRQTKRQGQREVTLSICVAIECVCVCVCVCSWVYIYACHRAPVGSRLRGSLSNIISRESGTPLPTFLPSLFNLLYYLLYQHNIPDLLIVAQQPQKKGRRGGRLSIYLMYYSNTIRPLPTTQ